MSKDTLYLLVGALAVVVVGFGISYLYERSQRPGFEIKVGTENLTIK